MLDRTIAWRHYGCTYSVANYSIQTYIEPNIYEINKYFFVVINIPKLRPNYTLCNMDVNPSSQNINLKLKLTALWLQSCDVADLQLVTILECWRQN